MLVISKLCVVETSGMPNKRRLSLTVTVCLDFQEGTMSLEWVEVTLSPLEASHHLPYPREEKRKGSVTKLTMSNCNSVKNKNKCEECIWGEIEIKLNEFN